MTKIIAYIRTSTDKKELNNQKLAILEYAQKNNLKINEFVEIQMSSRKMSFFKVEFSRLSKSSSAKQ